MCLYMKKLCRYFASPLLIVLLLFALAPAASADMGPKPSITITIQNLETDDYLIDLLVYDEAGELYASPLEYNGMGEQYSSTGYNDLVSMTIPQLETLHGINYDGWISESTRWNAYLLFADCKGNQRHRHEFGYFGTPETYKILIINNLTGEIRITDTIHREEFSSYVFLDYDEMAVVSSASDEMAVVSSASDEMAVVSRASVESLLLNIKKCAVALILTIAVEIAIALIMKTKNIKTILLANILTNLLLQAALTYVSVSYLLVFIIMELLIILAEYLIYSKFFKAVSRNRIIAYTLTANIVSASLTFLIK